MLILSHVESPVCHCTQVLVEGNRVARIGIDSWLPIIIILIRFSLILLTRRRPMRSLRPVFVKTMFEDKGATSAPFQAEDNMTGSSSRHTIPHVETDCGCVCHKRVLMTIEGLPHRGAGHQST
ncbi:hypothetical protein BDR07DRAFT_1408191 [Suillus spraguei]|nr:hypothetical protein BDR07DRAFT_1408191 [Suillus spraguei]